MSLEHEIAALYRMRGFHQPRPPAPTHPEVLLRFWSWECSVRFDGTRYLDPSRGLGFGLNDLISFSATAYGQAWFYEGVVELNNLRLVMLSKSMQTGIFTIRKGLITVRSVDRDDVPLDTDPTIHHLIKTCPALMP